VRLFLAGGAELDLEHLAPYVDEPWAKEEMGRAYHAADVYRRWDEQGAQRAPATENAITAEDLKAVQALEDAPGSDTSSTEPGSDTSSTEPGSDTSSTEPAENKADVHPEFPPDDWEIQGQKRALLEKGPGTEEHRSAVRILLSHGEAVSFDSLVHYVDEPWAREEMGRDRYQAARDLAAAKKLTRKMEAETDNYECRVCRVTKNYQVMDQYFIADGEGRYVCHDCMNRLGIKSEDIPKAVTEEEKCHQCNRLMPSFVMKEGTWPGTIKGELFCPECHEARSKSRGEQHA